MSEKILTLEVIESDGACLKYFVFLIIYIYITQYVRLFIF